jgi:transcription-repair coupling factor (superfamily II helicase)
MTTNIINIITAAQSDYIYQEYVNNKTDYLICLFSNEKELLKIYNELIFYIDESNFTSLLNYDTLPFDNVSPSSVSICKKLLSLYKLTKKTTKIILTTYQALVQKSIPKNILLSHIIKLEKNIFYKRDDLIATLCENSYLRVDNAKEPGHFAVRGSIIDIIDIHSEQGCRIDFLDNKIDKLKLFDPISQISTCEINDIEILPANEIIFNTDTIGNFYNYYNAKQNSCDDILNLVKHHHKFQAIEHFLPMFYNKLDSIFDYLDSQNFTILNFVENNDILEEYYNDIDKYYNNKISSYKKNQNLHPIDKNDFFIQYEDFLDIINVTNKKNISSFKSGENKPIYHMLPLLKQQLQQDNITLATLIKDLQKQYSRKIILSAHSNGSLERVKNLLKIDTIHYVSMKNINELNNLSKKTIGLTISNIEHGFISENYIIITDRDLFDFNIHKKSSSSKKLETLIYESSSLNAGEFVIHANHGIGKFNGIQTIEVANIKHDFLELIYDNNDKFFLPVENFELLSRISEDNDNLKLDKLGLSNWQDRKARVKQRIKNIAETLLKIAAERELKTAEIILPIDDLYNKFCNRFQYIETEDQLKAIKDVEEDFSSGKPTDRLICGDVGFGKTEIALRAAFMITNNINYEKYQVAVIVPTTILCKQHYETFSKRFEGFNINIRSLSRLTPSKDIKLIKEEIKNGSVDIVIGTHALLSSTINFNNLQLLIVDEEQHFGVTQKEKLKDLKNNIHVLTLSATPIPRTLQMSMVGIRDLSLIATPPIDRLAIKTSITQYDDLLIKETILREYNRNGKCFFVAPRVAHLDEIQKKLSILVPNIKTVIAHGQMKPSEIDSIMYDFYNGKYTVLISTTIIESGLDIPSANTILIHRADMFGLSALYQLRGRVGRSSTQSYAYLLLPKFNNLSKIAQSRLEILQNLDSLGVGFSIASHDMDIRGFGNLVGDEQSGHIKEVGVELYQSMLKDCINELKNIKLNEVSSWSPQINLGIAVLIPEAYIEEIHLRMGIYKRCANLNTIEDVDIFSAELIDRFGYYGSEVDHLLTTIKLKILSKSLNIEKIDVGTKGVTISFRDNNFAEPEKLIHLATSRGDVKIRADQKLFFNKSLEDIAGKINYAFKVLYQISDLIAKNDK